MNRDEFQSILERLQGLHMREVKRLLAKIDALSDALIILGNELQNTQEKLAAYEDDALDSGGLDA